MVNVVTARNRSQFSSQLDSMFEDRKNVFIGLLRWELPVIDGRLEVDQFDDDYAVYLIASDQSGNHMGSLRLLPADRPHILGNLFPYLCAQAVPDNAETMEITRLCLCPGLPASDRLRIRNQLISATVDYALMVGIKVFTGVVTARFLSQILVMGWVCEALGPSRSVDGTNIAAFRINIDSTTPVLLQAEGIYLPGQIDRHSRAEYFMAIRG